MLLVVLMRLPGLLLAQFLTKIATRIDEALFPF